MQHTFKHGSYFSGQSIKIAIDWGRIWTQLSNIWRFSSNIQGWWISSNIPPTPEKPMPKCPRHSHQPLKSLRIPTWVQYLISPGFKPFLVFTARYLGKSHPAFTAPILMHLTILPDDRCKNMRLNTTAPELKGLNGASPLQLIQDQVNSGCRWLIGRAVSEINEKSVSPNQP